MKRFTVHLVALNSNTRAIWHVEAPSKIQAENLAKKWAHKYGITKVVAHAEAN